MPKRDEPNPVLSFARRSENGKIDYWSPNPTGNWGQDNSTGRAHAAELIDQMRAAQAPMLLGHVVSKMIEKGKYGGIEVGFFSFISNRLIKEEVEEPTMNVDQVHIVVPFRMKNHNLVPGEPCRASSAASAERMAEAMASRYVGVAAYAATVDSETGDLIEPELLVQHGEIVDLQAH